VVLVILMFATYVGMLTVAAAMGVKVVVVGMTTGVVEPMTSASEKRHLATRLWVEEGPPLLAESS
jgi:hypothetical protein